MRINIYSFLAVLAILISSCEKEEGRLNPYDQNGSYYVDFSQEIEAELIIKEDLTPYLQIDASKLLSGSDSYLKCFNDSFIFTKENPKNEISLTHFIHLFNKNRDSVGLAPFKLSNGLEKDFKIKFPVNNQIFKVIDSVQIVDLYTIKLYYNTQKVSWIKTPITIEGTPENLPFNSKGVNTINLKTFQSSSIKLSTGFANGRITLDSASFPMFNLQVTNDNIHNPHFKITYNPSLLVEGCKISFVIVKDPNLWQVTSKTYTYDDLKVSNSLTLNEIYLNPGTQYSLKYKLDSLNSASPPFLISNFTSPQEVKKELNNFKPAIDKGEVISCFTINNVCYALSSENSDYSSAGRIFKYNSSTDTWEQLNLWAPYGTSPVAFAKDFVVFVSSDFIEENPKCYTFNGNAFTAMPNFSGYYTGGITFSIGNDVYLQNSNSTATRTINKYSSLSNTWSQIADMPSDRIFSLNFTLNNKAYVCAGKNSGFYLKKDMICYDPATNAWTTINNDFSNWDFGHTENRTLVYNNCAILSPPNTYFIGKTYTETECYDYIVEFSIINYNTNDYTRKFRFVIDDYYYLMTKVDSQTELSYKLTKTKL